MLHNIILLIYCKCTHMPECYALKRGVITRPQDVGG
jgi:hypothetical protein